MPLTETDHSNLEVPVLRDYPGDEFMSKWVYPFYIPNLLYRLEEFQRSYSVIQSQINIDIISQLLTYGNWRTRKVGSYFAAIEHSTTHCGHIGRLLLRPETYHADYAHVLALARFNTDEGILYLCKYLDHYLQHTEYQLEQGPVIGALVYLDKQNKTKIADQYADRLKAWCQTNDPELQVQRCYDGIARVMKSIRALSITSK